MDRSMFSEHFLLGLQTKSQGFQENFWSIVEKLCDFFDEEKDVKNFQTYIEENFSYYEKGNQLYSTGVFMCGKATADRREEYISKLQSMVIDLFVDERDWGMDYGIYTASHIFIAMHFPESVFTESDEWMLRFMIMLQRPANPPKVVTICNTSNVDCAEIFIAVMK